LKSIDRGGWSSKGYPTTCPKCGNDDATLIVTEIYGKTARSHYCSICAKDWEEDDVRDEEQ
jgi:protein-arginine kinase activator protein McsA